MELRGTSHCRKHPKFFASRRACVMACRLLRTTKYEVQSINYNACFLPKHFVSLFRPSLLLFISQPLKIPDQCASLPSLSTNLADIEIEIEHAHTPVPFGGSPTGEVVARSPRRREHSGGIVTLKRKGSSDITRASHGRSPSVDSSVSGCAATPRDSSLGQGSLGGETGGVVPLGTCSSAVGSPMPFRRVDSRGRRGTWGRGNSPVGASSAEAAQRIAVDPDSGHSFFVDRPTVCDACAYCDDVCEVAWCQGCDDRRAQLEHSCGPLLPSTRERQGGGGGGSGGSSLASPAGISFWSGCDSEDGDTHGSSTRSSSIKFSNGMPPSLSRRYSRKSHYTLCEVRRRKLTGACWVVCQGSVYDVTGALSNHPGGKRSVLRNAGGRDCEEDFHFHSKAAKRQWRQYRIGSLVTCVGASGEGADGVRTLRSGSDCVIS